jgi:hypothetical protein
MPLADNPVLMYEGQFRMKVIHWIHESYNCVSMLAYSSGRVRLIFYNDDYKSSGSVRTRGRLV